MMRPMTGAAALAFAAYVAAASLPAQARGQAVAGKAQSSTKAGGNLTAKGTFNPPGKNPKGLSVAGARAYQAGVTDIELSAANNANRAPVNGTDEAKNVGVLLNLTEMFSRNADASNRETQTDKLNGVANAATEEDKNAGEFLRIDKSRGLTAKATVAAGNANVGNENADATATQKVVGNSVSTNGTKVTTSVLAGTNPGSAPKVAAVAVNRDPFSVAWTSASDHSLTIDLSGSSFSASTAGVGSAAVAVADFQVFYVDAADDPDNTAQPSNPILDLALGVTSAGDDPASPFGILFAYNGGGSITDSLGAVGAAAVDADLASLLQLMPDGSFAIPGSYSITFDAGGSSDQGVLFLDNYNYGAALVPEPSSLALFAIGVVSLAALAVRRNARGL